VSPLRVQVQEGDVTLATLGKLHACTRVEVQIEPLVLRKCVCRLRHGRALDILRVLLVRAVEEGLVLIVEEKLVLE